MREGVRVVELCAMASHRRELAIQERRHVKGGRDLFRRNAELLGRDSPEVGFVSRFRQPRDQIRVETLRGRRVQEPWRVTRRKVFMQMSWEGVRVASDYARPGRELADGDVIGVSVQAVRAEGNDDLRAQLTNRARQLFQRRDLFIRVWRGHGAVFQVEEL